MTSTILPFTNNNDFSNIASAQEMGYYDDDEEYVDYNSDINYDSDDETYSDYQDGNIKYECRTGPFEGFFVSSPEFCKNVKFDNDRDDRKKDDSRDDNNKTGTPTPVVPPQNVTLDAKFSELRQIVNPNDLVILDGSGSTGNITSWSILQTGGQPSVTLQDVPAKQYSKQFTMPDTNHTLIFDLTVTNNQTGQQDTATTLVISNQTLALQACAGIIPNSTNYLTLTNTDNNFKIPYPEEFSAKLGNSVIVDNGDPPRVSLGNATNFYYLISKDLDCPTDFVHNLNVDILQLDYQNESIQSIENFIRNNLTTILFPDYLFSTPSDVTFRGTWETFQGNKGTFIDFHVDKTLNVSPPPLPLTVDFRTFYVIIDNFIYYITYSVDRSGTGLEQPNNFDIYNTYKVNYIVDSICFPINSQSNVQCPLTFPNPPPPPLFANISSTKQAIFTSPTQGCGAGIILEKIPYPIHNDPNRNVKITYPQDFRNVPNLDHIRFQYTIPINNAADCPGTIQTEHELDVAIFQFDYNNRDDNAIDTLAMTTAPKLMFTDTTTTACNDIELWTTPQGFSGKSVQCVINVNENREAQIYYVKIDNHIYVIIYSVVQEESEITFNEAPDNFNIYGIQRIQDMLDSLCFPENTEGVPCPSGSGTPSGQVTIEEWINTEYKEIPGIPDFDKVIITCTGAFDANVKCLDQPGKIIALQPFAGFNCIANPTGCDLGRLNVICVSDISKCDFVQEIFLKRTPIGGFEIHQPPDPEDRYYSKSWTAAAMSPSQVWILDRIDLISPRINLGIPDFDIQFTTAGVLTGTEVLDGKFFLKLFKTTECINGVCQEI